MKSIILETKHLFASAPTEGSLNNRFKLLSDPLVTKYLGDGKAKTKSETEEFLQKNIQHYQEHGFCFFDIYNKKTKEFIGDAGLIYVALNKDNKDVEVGYRLAQKYWGKGYASELAKAFIEWGFEEFNLEKIVACCKEDNIASSNVMKKCGMDYSGKYLYNNTAECDIFVIKNPIIKQ